MKKYLIVLFVLLTAGCASVGQQKVILLEDRVKEYWMYRINKRYEKSYEMEYPLFRKKVPLYRYMRMSYNPRINLKDFEIINIDEKEENAIVEIKLKMDLKAWGVKKPFPYETTLKDKWIKIEGMWYHVPSRGKSTQN